MEECDPACATCRTVAVLARPAPCVREPPACESELALPLSVAARAVVVVDAVVPTRRSLVKPASLAPLPPLPTDAPTLNFRPSPRFPFAVVPELLPGATLLETPPCKSTSTTLDVVVGVFVAVHGTASAAQKANQPTASHIINLDACRTTKGTNEHRDTMRGAREMT